LQWPALQRHIQDLLVKSTLPGYRAFSRSLSVKLISDDGVFVGDVEVRWTLLNEEDGDNSKVGELGESWWTGIGDPTLGGLAGLARASNWHGYQSPRAQVDRRDSTCLGLQGLL
jgi:hypothetical protein